MSVSEGDPAARRSEQHPDGGSYVSVEELKEILRNLNIPTPLRSRILEGAERERAIVGDLKVADEYLREVTQRVFGFSIDELSPAELLDIEHIRKSLGIPGEFDPSA